MRRASAALPAPGFSSRICLPACANWTTASGPLSFGRQTSAPSNRSPPSFRSASTESKRGSLASRSSRLAVASSNAGISAVISSSSATCVNDSRQPIPCGWSMPRTAMRNFSDMRGSYCLRGLMSGSLSRVNHVKPGRAARSFNTAPNPADTASVTSSEPGITHVKLMGVPIPKISLL